ncbi:outer membrane beta-barrel protein [Pseudobacteriovorax antillogorgiicola]|uniref:Outer membrane protein beta-barrel domain-containing protein n=1 Tax=Pseudobacteriovorax antillogorgiicola TaxID=1513793 RepID=A0A1Y6B7Z4_9BACT|nr:outer membrane beta-barrel protein [Pseudobacteriovorax antillogorgiicola]TCS58899.1 hypothetical protein EDD56_102414 [Pseudobacteriovorax antillogorgiicola]SME93412.1 hypothetical protein SAMN06296036_10229 [Pseudobacteriovorax antillogorgiicola]
MKTQMISLALLGALTSTMVTAAPSSQNEFGVDQVSPAQRYGRSTGSAGQVSITQSESTITDKASKKSVELDVQQTSVEAVGQYNLPYRIFAGLKVGLESQSTDTTTKRLTSNNSFRILKSDARADGYNLNPFVGVNITPNITAAYELGYHKASDDDDSYDYMQQKVGVSYHKDIYELGAVYQSQVKQTEANIASSVTLHGQAMVTDQLAVGGLIKRSLENRLDDSRNDTHYVKLTSQYALNDKWDLEGAVGFQPSSASDKDQVDVATAQSFDTQLGAYYQVQKNLQLGSAVKYGTFKDETDANEVDAKALAFSVKANYLF